MLSFAVVLCAYLLGSVPFGLLVTRVAGLGDIRAIGSGNIGTTNVLRTGRKSLALATLLLDGGKGTAAVLIAEAIAPGLGQIAGIAAFLGHLYPVWLKFRGGKGVATAFGVMLGVAWPIGIMAILTWLATAFLFRFSSLAALVAVAAAPLFCFWMRASDDFLLLAVMAGFIFFKHAANIRRLRAGTEPKIGRAKTCQP
jgi:glycerol-3-phosphate acyltransferase PlsY